MGYFTGRSGLAQGQQRPRKKRQKEKSHIVDLSIRNILFSFLALFSPLANPQASFNRL
jgi:hypothetical protein